MHKVPFERHETVRIGLIGAGGRGFGQLGELLACEGVAVTAVADIRPEAAERAAAAVIAAGQAPPAVFTGDTAWRQLIDSPLDLVYIATAWATHTPYAVAAMQAGKHAAVEVPAALTLEECWQLVETSEQTRRHCIMLENCCYDYWEMLTKRMVEAGMLGELVHAECAYIHDLRSELLRDQAEGLWRRQPHVDRNGNLYPTHGLGPVAQCLQIGDGDAFDYMVSMSSREAGLSAYRNRTVPADSPKRQEIYQSGDMNVSLLRTKLGRTIVLQHDVVTPRPYERLFLIAGTKGTFRDYPPRLFLDGVGHHAEWLSLESYKAAWEDPLWTNLGEIARKRGGHGGMDFIMNYRLIQTMREGLPPDMDVYDAADWSAPGPLSEQSVAQRSAAVDFPNFRRA
ncbi:MAG: Gfo/Idh/MocA family oxidoreductase [Chloroflexi bacterium]|nr:Gfo/Idh/MocA family oxidoreductase [Chloroflexota bacterium]